MTTAVQVQYRRGTATQVAAFTGAQGELVVDTTSNRVTVHDGATAGGFPAAKLYELPGGMRNKFRNGTMDLWQRGTASLTVTIAGAYTADGWIVLPSGASCTVQAAAGRAWTVNSLKITGASGVTDAIAKQRIESYIAASLSGETVTVQAQIYNGTGAALTPTLIVSHATSQDNFGSLTQDLSVNLQSCPNGIWTQIYYTFTASVSALNGLEVSFNFGNVFGSSSNYVQLTECDIRQTAGVPTGLNTFLPPTPELRPIPMEWEFCRRYYRKTTAEGGITALSTTAQFWVKWEGMRATPSLSLTGALTIAVVTSNYTQSSANISYGGGAHNSDGGIVELGNFSGMTTGLIVTYNDPANYILLSAEL